MSTPATVKATSDSPPTADNAAPKATDEQQPAEEKIVPWPEFLKAATDQQVQSRLSEELSALTAQFSPKLRPFCFLSLYDSADSIDSWESDQIYTALQVANPKHDKDIFLLLLSRGGQIDPLIRSAKYVEHSQVLGLWSQSRGQQSQQPH